MTTQNNRKHVSAIFKKTSRDSCVWDIEEINFPHFETISIAFLNAHAITLTYENEHFYDSLCSTDYLLRDGIGVKIAMKILGLTETENLNGTDLIPNLITKWKDKKLAIFGANEETLLECKRKLEQNGIFSVICTAHGFYNEDYYISLIKTYEPEILILCMGMPKQELLAKTIKIQKLCPIVICGGGWADFYSGSKKRAPKWIRRLSLEWLHRLCREPKRLGKRYTFGIVHFFYIVFILKFMYKKKSK